MKQPPFMRDGIHAPRPAEGSQLFLAQFTAYVVLLGFAYVWQSGLLKVLGNVYAVVIFGLVGFTWLVGRYPPSSWATAVFMCFATYVTGIACSLIVNPGDVLWGDLVKLTLAPAFLFFGAAFERARGEALLWQRPAVRLMFATLVAVPLLAWGAQLLQSGFEIDGVRETSIFANRNNASVYAVTVLGLFVVLTGKPIRSLIVFLGVGVMFGTLGVMLAVVIALALTVARPRELLALMVLVAAATAAYFVWPEWGPFKRVTPVVDSVRLLAEGRIKLHNVTFGELVLLLKTQDLSFVFRLKHWVDLLAEFAKGDAYNWLFGFGVGSSVRLSDLRLVPHNDYLRYLVEFGAVTLVSVLGMFALILARCGRRWETVPLLAVMIYLFSENLITNYTAIVFFYFTAGALAERIGREKRQQRAGAAGLAAPAAPAAPPLAARA